MKNFFHQKFSLAVRPCTASFLTSNNVGMEKEQTQELGWKKRFSFFSKFVFLASIKLS